MYLLAVETFMHNTGFSLLNFRHDCDGILMFSIITKIFNRLLSIIYCDFTVKAR